MRITATQQVAALIVDRRAQLGLTQSDLAEAAGVTRAWISRLESGAHDLRLSTLLAVLDVLHMTLTVAPETVAGDTGPVPGPDVLDDIIERSVVSRPADDG
ncbi:helix-turn-helix transcriptional regulator [Euzebya sp.]|uniref:helix-turn-helix transcriptional regulator n=1 Tax=Euzebya sp. TaxID=1971409 RepID=UPI003511BE57